ncbi:alpha/beta hydrolase fold-3 domain protein [gamma proteobacterium HTCC5015]|nr:alpha/beta hydrolase fold-3 domain protein [gamma proteobacterium HTCC5015]
MLKAMGDISQGAWLALLKTVASGANRAQGRSRRAEFVSLLTRHLLNQSVHQPMDWMRQRQRLLPIRSRDEWAVHCRNTRWASVPCIEVIPKSLRKPQRTVIYLHGGGYVIGSAHGYKAMAATLAVSMQARVVLVDYRLAPEHVFPAAHDDCVAAAEAILRDADHPVAVAGDSAGGALSIDVCVQLAGDNAEQPLAACGLISPWVDPMWDWQNDASETDILSPDVVAYWIDTYMGERPKDNPRIRSAQQPLNCLPETILHVSEQEIFFQQIDTFHQAALAAQVSIHREDAAGQFHVFQVLGAYLPEARPALQKFAQQLLNAI